MKKIERPSQSVQLEWSTLAHGAQEISVEGISGRVASLDISRAIAQICVTTRETKKNRTKGSKFGPASLSTALVSKSLYSAWKRRSARNIYLQ